MSINSSMITLNEEQVVSNSTSGSNVTEKSLSQSPEKRASNKKKTLLESNLDKLAQLIANITESYTTVIFVADNQSKILHPLAHHTLSRDFNEKITIPFGRGLVGWTAENKVRITVCPFEHDSSTLLYYPTDQALKSFIAVPILGKGDSLIGVIACDSKKNYAFAKIQEKLLTECAIQAQIIIDLHLDNQKLSVRVPNPNLKSDLEKSFETLRTSRTEEQLFESVCHAPQNLINREAMIALVTSHEGFGESTFYSYAKDSRIEHHLVDLVCKHKKVTRASQSVHVIPNEELKARSFLSVPVHVFGREVGSLNVLSAPFKGFLPSDIEALEKLAKTCGRELETLRSRSIINSRQIGPSLLPWRHFISKSNALLGLSNNTNHNQASEFCLLRIQLKNLFCLEQELGVKNLAEIHEQILRFVQQVAPQPMLASAPYGTSIYILGQKDQISSVSTRLANVISKIPYMDTLDFHERLPENAAETIGANLDLREITIKTSVRSIEECIKENSTPSPIEVKKPTAAQIPQNPRTENSQTNSATFAKNKNSFDQRLSQALKVQDTNKSSVDKNQSDEFVLGELNEDKEVANARFW